ncbi:hypothetical protein A9P82_13660 [Arachidicoccus ginsenosidimutans]|uniref:DUF420 domain-containing protein n=1 Tax=Arachidicoccus sp. BS20 TaxID=1850526 RepID=UPI0007F06702|nr:DUF420 domain-containing protein [Arachidicoccus sp. BS20]ANI90245.1 hypothetical protein A9P82_13660 [Arachidicoccus sp. BS20]
MLQAAIQKNDKKAKWLIGIVSAVIFGAVVVLDRHIIHPTFTLFDVRYFALANAVINTLVTICLLAALWAVKRKKFELHRNFMFAAIILSVLFLLSYICHHLFAGDTVYGGTGAIRYVYYFILISHIALVTIMLPFILFTAYRGLTGEWAKHKKIARYTFPSWLYISVTGPIIYFMIAPYYH